jgi:hypothetical protein
MADCYRHEELRFDSPVFRGFCHTYLITMVGSTRRPSYMRELRSGPTAEVHVVHNKGYEACDKPAWVRQSSDDLWAANLHIFADFLNRSRDPWVLVLEDDVQFTSYLKTKAHEVERFLAHRSPDAYCLGTLALVVGVRNGGHYPLRRAGTAHAVIYSAEACRRMLRDMRRSVGLHDQAVIQKFSVWAHRYPLAIQPFDETTVNMSQWPRGSGAALRALENMVPRGTTVFHASHACQPVGGLIPMVVIAIILGLGVIATIIAVPLTVQRRRRLKNVGRQRLPPSRK